MSTALKNDISIQIQNLQTDYMGRIQQVTASGDFNKVQELMKEMELQIKAMVEEHTKSFQVPVAVPPAFVHSYNSPHSDLDLNSIVYSNEQVIYSKLLKNPEFLNLKEHITKNLPPSDTRKDLMRNHLKLDLQLSPKLAEVVTRCREALKIKSDIQVYLINSPEANAYCPPPTEDTVLVCLTSTLLEKLSVDELCYVFGHEIGHALMNHHEVPLLQILNTQGISISPDQMLEIFSLKRAAELTCDRFGLICGRTFENAARGVFKIYYGLSDLGDSSIHAYMKNFGDLNSSISISPADFYSTHPFGPIRLIALQYFATSENFHNEVGSEKAECKAAELETKIDSLMRIYDAHNVTSEMQAVMDQYFAICGISIAASDGHVSPEEIKKMTELCKTPGVIDQVMGYKSASIEQLQSEIFRVSKHLLSSCSLPLRMKLVRDITFIALADGILTETEQHILYFCAQTAGVDPRFIEDTLRDLIKLT